MPSTCAMSQDPSHREYLLISSRNSWTLLVSKKNSWTLFRGKMIKELERNFLEWHESAKEVVS